MKKTLGLLLCTLCYLSLANDNISSNTVSTQKSSFPPPTKTNESNVKYKKTESAINTVTKVKPIANVTTNIECDSNSPCAMVKDTSDQVFTAINKNLSPKQTMKLINNVITPHFNFELMTKYAMGQNWKQATETEQEQLINNFKNLLIFTYSTALTKFKGSKIVIIKQNVNEKKSSVIAQVTLPNSAEATQPISVEYDLAKLPNEDSWRVYDIKIENASLVTTYRNQFNDIVATKKVSGLIKDLNNKVNSLQKNKS